MRLIFLGTPEFAVPILAALINSDHEVVGVVTQPDRPKGRDLKKTPSAIKVFAQEKGLALYQPEKVSAPEFLNSMRQLKPDLAIVASFGQIFKKELLELPRLGCWNVHASLLPKYRGATPITRSILEGESQTGVSLMKMGEGVDDGPVLTQATQSIQPDDTKGELEIRLAELGADLIRKNLEDLLNQKREPKPQEHSLATFTTKLKKEDSKISWEKSALEIHNLVRAMNPAPGAFSFWKGNRLKIWRTEIINETSKQPGEIFKVLKDQVYVATGSGGIALKEVQLPGKKSMPISTFCAGHSMTQGDSFENVAPSD